MRVKNAGSHCITAAGAVERMMTACVAIIKMKLLAEKSAACCRHACRSRNMGEAPEHAAFDMINATAASRRLVRLHQMAARLSEGRHYVDDSLARAVCWSGEFYSRHRLAPEIL